MKIQTPTEFLTFNDGFCDIYTVKGNLLTDKIMHLPFGERTVGIKRFYAARAASTKIDRLIQIPCRLTISAVNRAVIGNTEYKIEQAQHLKDTNPPVTVLSLQNFGAVSL